MHIFFLSSSVSTISKTCRQFDINIILHVLVRNSANATWPCCRTDTPRRPANGFAAACPTPGPSGPSATGPAGRVLGTDRYCFASSTSVAEKRGKFYVGKTNFSYL